MFGWLKDQNFPVVLLFVGFILIIVGFFKITDITELNITAHQSPIYFTVVLGTISVVGSVLIFISGGRSEKLPQDLDQQPQLIEKSVFLSAPMNSFVAAGRPDDYSKNRAEILKIMGYLKKYCKMKDVYYAGENIDDVKNFDLPGKSLKDDFRKIQEREFYILTWPEKFASRSSLLEAGIALTMNKKCIYLIKSEDDLPFLLKGAQNATRNVKIIKYQDLDHLLNAIQLNGEGIFDFKKIG